MKVKIVRSAVIDAPIGKVWAVLRDFNSHRLWHEAVSGSTIENDLDGDVVGCVRRFNVADRAEIREQLLYHSDSAHTYSYCILDSTLPLFDQLSTLRLMPVTDQNQTFIDWRSEFRVGADRAQELKTFVESDLFEAGFTGLRKFLAEPAGPLKSPVEKTKVAVGALSASEPLSARAIVLQAVGGPEVMSLRWVTVPEPKPDQVRIRQTAIAVNYVDLPHRQGQDSYMGLPGTPGATGVGEIIDVGSQVHGFFMGDRVAYLSRNLGAYAEIRCLDADTCLALPAGLSDLEASTLFTGITAGLLLGTVFRAVSGKVILIQSIAGDLGHLLGQWASSMNLKVIGTVSTREKARFIRDLGCDFPIVLEERTNVPDEVMRLTKGRGVDYWVHSGDAGNINDALFCLGHCGHLVVTDGGGERSISIDLNSLKKRSLTLSVPVCFDYIDDQIHLQRLAYQYFGKIQNRSILPAVKTFPLDQAGKAHKLIESRQNMGSVALIPED